MKQELSRKLRTFASAVVVGLLSALLPVAGMTHEFWLQPETFHPQVGDTVLVDTLIGADFTGDSLPYIPDLVKKFTVLGRDGERPAGAGFAADPAGKVDIDAPGLHILAFQNNGTDTEVDWPVFEKYLRDEGLDQHLPAAKERADNYAGIATEFYSRHAIALIQSGPARDVVPPRQGLTLEFHPAVNPYALADGAELPVQLIWHGRPAAGVQVHVLNDITGGTVAKLRSDHQGMVHVRLDRRGIWMLNAVTMVPDPTQKFHWRSYWTSLTFSRN